MAKQPESFVITLSSKLSGSYNAACVGRDIALEADPSLKIHVFDSESASAGETRIALFLRDLIDAGLPFEEIVEKATAFIATMKTHFVLEDLSHLVKNGRISRAAGLIGTVLNIRPIMGENGHGELRRVVYKSAQRANADGAKSAAAVKKRHRPQGAKPARERIERARQRGK